MLQVQDYLRSGKTHADLETELGIKATLHDSLPLVILNYNQIDSPKTHPIVRECRGLVLRSDNHDLVARAFGRFYNWGEVADEMPLFDFSDFFVQSKEDGSLVLIYHFDGQWRANTRGSFGLDNMQFCDFTWQQAFAAGLHIPSIADFGTLLTDGANWTDTTFVFEFCSPYNKIVRRYPESTMYLLTAFKSGEELSYKVADKFPFLRPQRYEFKSLEEIQDFLDAQAAADPTFEGVVICDRNGHRWKIKSATYLGLHRLKGEGDNLFNPKHLIPFIMAGEEDELLTYFPEVKDTYEDAKRRVNEAYAELEKVWQANFDIETQKDFALAIIGKTPFTGLLFQLRKTYGREQKQEYLKKLWRDSSDTILKHVFKERHDAGNQDVLGSD